MATKKKGLGRGLEALLGPSATQAGGNASLDATPSELPLSQMVPGMYQPRTRMDEGALYELAESIKSQGIMQPILVRKLAVGAHAGKYEIIAGERRFRAAKLAGLSQVPVLVREVSDENTAIMALIENMQREDLNALEEAQGFIAGLLGSMTDVLVACDLSGRVEQVNLAAERAFGLRADALLGRSLSDLLDPSSETTAADVLATVARRQRIADREFTLATPDGPLAIAVNGALRFDPRGRAVHVQRLPVPGKNPGGKQRPMGLLRSGRDHARR